MVKKAKKQPKKDAAASGRVRKLDKKQAKQKAKESVGKQAPIPSSFMLLAQVFKVIKNNWQVLSGIVLAYTILNVIFANGVVSDLNSSLDAARQSHNLSTAFNGFGSLLSLGSSSGNAQGGSSAAQSLLLVFESLVIIWALRQLLAGRKIGVKQAYYQSMGPLVPFFLIVLVIIIELLPLTLGSALLGLVLSSSISSGTALSIIFGFFFIVLASWTIYMVSASLFGLYIVTLPDMQPRQALGTAKNLVHFRRWMILRRLFFLPIFIVLILGVITIPLILVLPSLAAPAFFVLLMIVVLFVHAYLYSLYRGLIA